MSRFLSPRFTKGAPYVPGEQPKDRRFIKLNTNESPFPPGPKTRKALCDTACELRLYSDPDGGDFRKAVSQSLGVPEKNVLITGGSDETLALCFMAYCDMPMAFPRLTYGLYTVLGEMYRIDYRQIPMRGMEIDANDYLSLNRAVALANPNAPTGLALDLSAIEAIAGANRDRIVAVDEAYVDFGGESCLNLTRKYDNLILIHTFSKSHCLAGARLAYAVADESLIGDMNRVKYSFNPYDVSRASLAAGAAALSEDDYYRGCTRKIIETRARAAKALADMGFEMTDSRANFLFVRHGKLPGGDYAKRLRDKGVLVRHFSDPLIADWTRVTVGSDGDMDILINATKEALYDA